MILDGSSSNFQKTARGPQEVPTKIRHITLFHGIWMDRSCFLDIFCILLLLEAWKPKKTKRNICAAELLKDSGSNLFQLLQVRRKSQPLHPHQSMSSPSRTAGYPYPAEAHFFGALGLETRHEVSQGHPKLLRRAGAPAVRRVCVRKGFPPCTGNVVKPVGLNRPIKDSLI